MSLQIFIPDQLAAKIAAMAESQGKRPEDLVIEAIENKLNPLARLDELMAPVRARIAELGESEDDVVEFFEKVKHEMRKEHQSAGQ
jgi:hypothetical protein